MTKTMLLENVQDLKKFPSVFGVHLMNVNVSRASPSVLNMWALQNHFSHPSLVIYLFCNPTHKTETRITNRWGTTNSKPPGGIITISQSETNAAAVRSYLLHSFFCRCTRIGVPFTSHRAVSNYAEPNPIFLSQTSTFWLFLI
jgi:hypothetical protein